jgi:hypothetical protein
MSWHEHPDASLLANSGGVIVDVLRPGLDYCGDFEVHLTVRCTDYVERFRDWCAAEGCKCVWIMLARGVHPNQPMATWRRQGTVLSSVLAEAIRFAQRLDSAGFAIVRLKIEVDPSNNDVPATDDAARLLPPGNYFEHHVKLKRPAGATCERLVDACTGLGAHLSRNAWRQPEAGMEERFVTLRASGVGRNESFQRLQHLLEVIDSVGESVLDIESEYTVYDSNLAIDAGWLQDFKP